MENEIKTAQLEPKSIISMNDYPPLHSPDSLKKYFGLFTKGKSHLITPIPVIPASVADVYFKKDVKFQITHPEANYFMFDGTHRAAAAMLAHQSISAYLVESDSDIDALLSLRHQEKLSITGLKSNLVKTIEILRQHYSKIQRFWTLEEKVHAMISNGDIPDDILAFYRSYL